MTHEHEYERGAHMAEAFGIDGRRSACAICGEFKPPRPEYRPDVGYWSDLANRWYRVAPPAERFWPKVNRHGPMPLDRPDLGRCWQWTAKTRTGYGVFRLDGRHVAAHRVAYEWLRGDVPAGMELDHLCRNRGCVNPDHLEPVDNAENKRRGTGFNAVNAAKTHCLRGHPLDGDNLYSYRGRRICRACWKFRRRAA